MLISISLIPIVNCRIKLLGFLGTKAISTGNFNIKKESFSFLIHDVQKTLILLGFQFLFSFIDR